MAKQNVFEKIHVEEKDKADLSGVLEQLNLPPAVVEFVRRNQKAIYIVLAVVAVVVVAWSLYGSYVDKKTEESSSALTAAMSGEGEGKIAALEKVIQQYGGTESALWARIEIAETKIRDEQYDTALSDFNEVRGTLDDSDGLYPLTTFGIAQLHEIMGNNDKALAEYQELKTIEGFENLGYTGLARIYEAQGQFAEAVTQLEEYRGMLISEDPSSAEKSYITNKISLLKAQM